MAASPSYCRRSARRDATTRLVKQNALLALEISHRAYVFEIGKIALSGDSRALAEDSRIRKVYMGA